MCFSSAFFQTRCLVVGLGLAWMKTYPYMEHESKYIELWNVVNAVTLVVKFRLTWLAQLKTESISSESSRL